MECLVVSIARFTYVPDEHYDTIEAAFAAKPLAEWTALVAHSQLTLAIEKTPDKVILKCLDGEDVRRTWDLSAIKRESTDDPSRRVVIVKFPHIVFRWYNRQEKVLRRIQFKLNHHREFTTFTNFCAGHFGAVRDLYDSSGGSIISTGSGETDKASSATYTPGSSSPPAPRRSALSQISPSQKSSPNWIQKSSQPRSLTRILADAESKANAMNTPKKYEAVKVTTGSQTEEILQQIGGVGDEPLQLTETIMMTLIQDDSFKEEVVQIWELWNKVGMNRHLFGQDI